MKYEIAYVSLSGNTEKLAYGIAEKFPVDKTIVTDLQRKKIDGNAQVCFVGFGVNRGSVPLKIMEALEDLHNTKIMFFVTSGMEPTDEYQAAVEKKLLPFLPDDCNYCGMFMCQGEVPEAVVQAARNKLFEDPGNKLARKILDNAELSIGHPNLADCDNACRYFFEHL